MIPAFGTPVYHRCDAPFDGRPAMKRFEFDVLSLKFATIAKLVVSGPSSVVSL